MKHKLIGFIAPLLTISNANAVSIVDNDARCKIATCTGNETMLDARQPANCEITKKCIHNGLDSIGYWLYACASCPDGVGYITTLEIPGCINTVSTVVSCDAPLQCDDCTSDTDFVSTTPGYEKKVNRRCVNGICNATDEYQCTVGYYGNTTNGTSGCAQWWARIPIRHAQPWCAEHPVPAQPR